MASNSTPLTGQMASIKTEFRHRSWCNSEVRRPFDPDVLKLKDTAGEGLDGQPSLPQILSQPLLFSCRTQLHRVIVRAGLQTFVETPVRQRGEIGNDA